MKFCLVDRKIQEAQPGLSGECRDCGAAMIAKCGEHRVWHWAHLKTTTCDPWWEPETEWHRAWKNRFPEHWQEISHTSSTGEKHRADVKTEKECVIEFQHSALSQVERGSRENFYPNLVWVVDGRRRVRDAAKFSSSLRGPLPGYLLPTYSMNRNDGALLRDWGACRVPVYFDFADRERCDAAQLDQNPLWLLHPIDGDSTAYISPVARSEFIKARVEGVDFEEEFKQVIQRDIVRMHSARVHPLAAFERRPALRRTRRF
ncbi:MAG TPA: competence protein CoiA family protein [Pseudolabrys sp.]|nr:competence protein CoiA family protein [Pseudolabrys sp.]